MVVENPSLLDLQEAAGVADTTGAVPRASTLTAAVDLEDLGAEKIIQAVDLIVVDTIPKDLSRLLEVEEAAPAGLVILGALVTFKSLSRFSV